MRVKSYILIKNDSYMIFYDTVLSVNDEEVNCHFLLYLSGNPRDLLKLYKEHEHEFSLPIYYVMEIPRIFSNHSIPITIDSKGRTLYKFKGNI